MAKFSQTWEANQGTGAGGWVGSIVETDFAVADTGFCIKGKIDITTTDNAIGWARKEVDSASFGAFISAAIGGWNVNGSVLFDFNFQFRIEPNRYSGVVCDRSWDGDKESDSWGGGFNCQTDFLRV